jgi:hypothetical protein
VNLIKQIAIFSDKCGPREIEKMELDFAKELEKAPCKETKIMLGKYLKGTDKQVSPRADRSKKDGKEQGSEKP